MLPYLGSPALEVRHRTLDERRRTRQLGHLRLEQPPRADQPRPRGAWRDLEDLREFAGRHSLPVVELQQYLEIDRDLAQRREQQPDLLAMPELGRRRRTQVRGRHLGEVEALSLAVPGAQELAQLAVRDGEQIRTKAPVARVARQRLDAPEEGPLDQVGAVALDLAMEEPRDRDVIAVEEEKSPRLVAPPPRPRAALDRREDRPASAVDRTLPPPGTRVNTARRTAARRFLGDLGDHLVLAGQTGLEALVLRELLLSSASTAPPCRPRAPCTPAA